MPKPLKSQLVFSVLMIACYLLSNSQHCQFVRAQNSASTSKNSKDFVIKGRCLKYDLENRPDGQIVNAKVTLFTHRGLSMEMKQLQQTSTDDEGRFVFDPVAEPSGNRFTRRSYALKVETDGYMAFAEQVNFQGTLNFLEKHNINLLSSDAVLNGRVVNEAGENILGATVEVHQHLPAASLGYPVATTKPNGLFCLEGFPPIGSEPTMVKRCVVTVRHPDYPTHFREIGEEDINKGAIRIVLPQGMTLSGQVLDAQTKSPLPGLMVLAIDDEQVDHNFAVTDQDGKYQLHLAEGRYQLRLEDESLVAMAQVFDGFSGDTLTAEPMLAQPGGWIVGQVTDKRTGKPVSHEFDGTFKGPHPQRFMVGCHGPARPVLGAIRQECLAEVDDNGRYRMRVYPGKNYPFFNLALTDRRPFDTLEMPPIIVTAGEESVCDFSVEPFKR